MKNRDVYRSVTINLNRQFLTAAGRLTLIGLLLGLLIWILPYSGAVLTPFIISILLSFLLDPVVIFLERNGFSRVGAVMLIMAFFILLITLLIVWLSPIISVEVKSITKMLNQQSPMTALEKVKARLIQQVPFLSNPEIAQKLTEKLEEFVTGLLNRSIEIIPNILSMIIMIFLVPFMTFFLLKDAPQLKKRIIQMVPNRYFEMALSLVHKISNQLGSYIRGQLMVSLIIGTLSMLALYILDVPYFFFIGTIAGMANMIPYFGPISGAVLALIVNFIDKGTFTAVIVVVIAFAVIRLIDDTIISPNILARSVEISPLLVIVVIFIGGEMFGLLGLLLCIPVTGIIKVTVKELIWSFKHYRLL